MSKNRTKYFSTVVKIIKNGIKTWKISKKKTLKFFPEKKNLLMFPPRLDGRLHRRQPPWRPPPQHAAHRPRVRPLSPPLAVEEGEGGGSAYRGLPPLQPGKPLFYWRVQCTFNAGSILAGGGFALSRHPLLLRRAREEVCPLSNQVDLPFIFNLSNQVKQQFSWRTWLISPWLTTEVEVSQNVSLTDTRHPNLVFISSCWSYRASIG